MAAEPASEPVLDPALDGQTATGVRRPSLAMSLLAIAILVVLISTTVLLFGTDATGGPLQVALFTSALLAGLLALRLGMRVAQISDAVVGGISSAMSAIFILLAVGALIGTWNMAGTIPTVVYYGLGILTPAWFYLSTVIICGLVGLTIGSSWTTAATLGVAFVALAPLLGADPVIAAGAVISGAYFGDKMTPISETTVLVPSMVGGVTVNQHVGAMIWTSGPAIGLALLGFILVGITTPASGSAFDPTVVQEFLAGAFNISLLNVVPSLRQAPPFLAIFGTAIFAAVLAIFTQPDAVETFVGDPSQGPVATAIKAIYAALATGFVSDTGNE